MSNSPRPAPDYSLHREGVVVADSLVQTNRSRGINMGGYGLAHIQVVPTGSANPTATILFWSEGKGAFIGANTSISKTGLGAGVPYEFTVDCQGRIMLVVLTGTIGAATNVYVSGYEMQHTP